MQQAKTRAATAVTVALEYLASHLDNMAEHLDVAVSTYALHLAGHPYKDEAFAKLRSMRKDGVAEGEQGRKRKWDDLDSSSW